MNIPELIDSIGFDNVLREVAIYAEECANRWQQNKDCRRAFYKAMAEIDNCADRVESILVSD